MSFEKERPKLSAEDERSLISLPSAVAACVYQAFVLLCPDPTNISLSKMQWKKPKTVHRMLGLRLHTVWRNTEMCLSCLYSFWPSAFIPEIGRKGVVLLLVSGVGFLSTEKTHNRPCRRREYSSSAAVLSKDSSAKEMSQTCLHLTCVGQVFTSTRLNKQGADS